MKEIKVALIIILTVAAVGLIAVLCMGMASGKERGMEGKTVSVQTGRDNCSLINTVELDVSNVESLEVRYKECGGDIILKKGEGSHLVLMEYANWEDKKPASIIKNGSSLKIEEVKEKIGGFRSNYSCYAELYIPESFHPNLKIETASGDIIASEITLQAPESIEIRSASGDIEAEVSEGVLEVISTSGNIAVKGASGEINAGTTSGDIELLDVGGIISAASTSGGIQVSGSELSGEFTSTSGDIDLTFKQLSGDLQGVTVSGSQTVTFLEDNAFSFESSTASGSVNTFFDVSFSPDKRHAKGQSGTDGSYKISMQTTSGDIDIMNR